MKKNYKSLCLITLLSGMSSLAVSANDGTITFSGTISDATCEISGGDETDMSQGNDFTVHMPNVSTTALGAGKFAGDTPFYINLSGSQCPNGKVANVVFERAQSTNIDSATGYLKNTVTTGGAENVYIRILNVDKQPLNLNNSTSHQPLTIASNKAQFTYWGQYAAVGAAAKAGTVKTDVVYSITYN